MDDLANTSLSLERAAVDLLLRLNVETSLDIGKSTQFRCGEVSGEINGTSNILQVWEADGVESSVVGDLVCTSNRDKNWHRDVGKSGVVNKC